MSASAPKNGPWRHCDKRAGFLPDRCSYEVFNVTNDTHSVAMTTDALLTSFCAGVPVRRALGLHESVYINA